MEAMCSLIGRLGRGYSAAERCKYGKPDPVADRIALQPCMASPERSSSCVSLHGSAHGAANWNTFAIAP
jgi:hypothetical protein